MGQERTLSFGTAPAGVAASPEAAKSMDSLGYLDDDEDPHAEESDSKAMAPWGIASTAGGWLTEAASFVSTTLYW